MFSENTLIYQKDLQLGPYFGEWQLMLYVKGCPDFLLIILQNKYSGPNS